MQAKGDTGRCQLKLKKTAYIIYDVSAWIEGRKI